MTKKMFCSVLLKLLRHRLKIKMMRL